MKVLEQFKSLKSLEIGSLILFIIFIIFPFKLPLMVANIVDSSLGLVFLFIVTIYLFFHTNPILGVIFILVAYELIRRSTETTGGNYMIRDNTTQNYKDAELQQLNPLQPTTLEEEVISIMAPARNEFIKGDLNNDFIPVTSATVGASLI